MLLDFLCGLGLTVFFLMAVILIAVALWRVGAVWIARAPFLDVVVSCLTWVPWVAALVWGNGWTLLGSIAGGWVALQVFCIVAHFAQRPKRPTIHSTLNGIVGLAPNHLGLWLTLPALPVFLLIRAAELFVYPVLRWVLPFPKYRQGDWVNVSRQKFEGLIGHDLIWCLYCDWMTGVYSLGAEMLRNIESFWCPIKFYEGKKCANCRIDFPDVDEWVKEDGTMRDVAEVLERKYAKDNPQSLSWWGHEERRK